MPSAIYPKYKEAILQSAANSNMASGTVRAALVDTGTYTYSAAHEFYSSVSGVVGTPATLASKTFVNGLFDAADITYTGVSGNSVEAVVIYIDTGSAATSRLVAFIDSFSAVTPNGGDITINWSASGIFQL